MSDTKKYRDLTPENGGHLGVSELMSLTRAMDDLSEQYGVSEDERQKCDRHKSALTDALKKPPIITLREVQILDSENRARFQRDASRHARKLNS